MSLEAERVSPLNNPSSRVPPIVSGNKYTQGGTGGKGVKESPRTIGGRGAPVCALVKCLACGQLQNIVYAYAMLPKYHRCLQCTELQPIEGYQCLTYGWPPLLPPERLRETGSESKYGRMVRR